jgi:hypothetical protein
MKNEATQQTPGIKEEQENFCPKAPGDSRDPAFNPEHDWKYLGECDGTSFFQCRHCKQSFES